MEKNNKMIYREIQKPRQFWVWIVVLLIALLFTYGFIQQILLGNPFGSNPAPDWLLLIFWFIFGIIFPVVLAFFKLIIEIRVDGVYIRYVPFHLRYRRILFKEIENYEPIVYSFFEFGGWGIRVNSLGEKSYTMYGNKGIKINLKNETVVLGTQKQNEMIEAIEALKERQ